VNKKAANYDPALVTKLIAAIKKTSDYFTIYEPVSAGELVEKAEMVCGLSHRPRPLPEYLVQRGKVTALVAAGGDGTCNLLARVALAADLPLGVLPMGRFNNIARSLYGSVEADDAIGKILKKGYRRIDAAMISGHLVIGSLGLGLIPELARLLAATKTPRFGFRWSQLGTKAVSATQMKKMTIKVDSFRFDLRPTILNVNLLPYTAGLPLSPASIFDDRQVETIFDVGNDAQEWSSFIRSIFKKKYVYGNQVRLFRGQSVTIQPIEGQTVYIDGELITLPTSVAEIQVGEKQLKVFC
jgi:diacylglycerol kinase family enzyme